MTGTPMEPRPVTDDDLAFWIERNGAAAKVDMLGQHLGALDIEVVRSHVVGWGYTWNVPYVVPDGDGSTYWFTMHTDPFPPVSAVVQAPPDEPLGDPVLDEVDPLGQS